MGDDGNNQDKGGAPDKPDFARATVRGPGDPLKRTLPLQLLHTEEETISGVRRLGDEAQGAAKSSPEVPAPPETLRSLAPPPPNRGTDTGTEPAPSSKPPLGLGGTMLGLPAMSTMPPATSEPPRTEASPRTEPSESERPVRHTDPGPVAAGASRRSVGQVRGDVSAAPVQPIGPKITISSSERPPIRRVTAPESFKVVDAPAESDAGAGSTADGPPVKARAERMHTPVDRPAPPGSPASGYTGLDDDPGAHRGRHHGRRSLPPEVKRKRRLKDVALLVGVAAVVGIAFVLTDTPPTPPDSEAELLEAEASPSAPEVGVAAAPPVGDDTVAPSGPTTRIVTVPEGAEILYGGAVVASTPADVERPKYASDYLIRKRGFMSQLVRLAPNSPKAITLELKPALADGPASGPEEGPRDVAASAPSAE